MEKPFIGLNCIELLKEGSNMKSFDGTVEPKSKGDP